MTIWPGLTVLTGHDVTAHKIRRVTGQ
jgi:hypothetical protein